MAPVIEAEIEFEAALFLEIEPGVAGFESHVVGAKVPARDAVRVVAAAAGKVQVPDEEPVLLSESVVLAEFVGAVADVAAAELEALRRLRPTR